MNSQYEDLEREFSELEAKLGTPELIADSSAYASAAKRYNELQKIVGRLKEQRSLKADVETAEEMLAEADAEDSATLRSEIGAAAQRLAELDDELLELLVLRDPNDDKNVIVEIRGAEGGEEANLFANDLYQMYQSFAVRKGWKSELLGAQPSPKGATPRWHLRWQAMTSGVS